MHHNVQDSAIMVGLTVSGQEENAENWLVSQFFSKAYCWKTRSFVRLLERLIFLLCMEEIPGYCSEVGCWPVEARLAL